MSYGPHLMLDCKSSYRLNDLDYIFEFLNRLPEAIGMTKITQPHVFRYNAEKQQDSGITGVVLIAESHISVHTYPAKGYLFIDVFSCKPFDIKKTQELIMNWFQTTACTKYAAARGRDFPRDNDEEV